MATTNFFAQLGLQSVLGTPVAATETFDVRRDTLRFRRENIDHDTAGESLDSKDVYGMEFVDGTIEGPVEPDSGVGLFLRAHYGPPVTSGSGPFTHVFKDTDDTGIGFLTARLQRDDATNPLAVYEGVFIPQLEFACEVGGQLMLTSTVYGRGVSQAAGVTPTFQTENPFIWIQATVSELDGTPITVVRAFNWNSNQNIDTETHAFGAAAFPIGKVPARQGLEEGLTVTFTEPNITERDKWVSSGLTSDWHFTFTNGVESIDFEIPKARIIDRSDNNIDSRNSQRDTYTYKINKDASAGFGTQITLVNNVASYA